MMDHVTDGRITWNVVTSYSNSAEKAMGREQVMSHDERFAGKYLHIHSCANLAYQFSCPRIHKPYLSNVGSSWEDGAQVWQSEPTMAASIKIFALKS